MRTKTVTFYLTGFLLTMALCLAVIELTTRTGSWLMGKGFWLALHELEPYDQPVAGLYQWHPFTGITFKPNTTLVGSHPNQREHAVITVDADGFLGPTRPLTALPDDQTIRIATIGASTTANLNLPYHQNWPGYLGMLVQQAFPDKKIRILNAAVPGFDTAQSIANLALRVMPFQPHLVIIYHAYNDLKAIRPNLTFKPDYSHIHTRPYGYHDKPYLIIRVLNRMMFYVRIRNNYRQYQETLALHQDLFPTAGQRDRLDTVMPEALQAFKQHIRLLTAIAHAEGARVVLSSFATLHDPSLDYTKEHNLQALSRLQKRELRLLMHFTPGLTLSAIFEGLRQYNRALREIAETEQTGWVDNATLMPHEDAYFVDRVHFSKQGAQRLAANMLPAVLEALSKD